MGKIYLTGILDDVSNGSGSWIEYAIKELEKSGIACVYPYRFKQYLIGRGFISGSENGTNEKGETRNDSWVVRSSDAVLANLLNAPKVFQETLIEYGWADLLLKPVISIMEKEGNLHDCHHIREISRYVVDNLESGLSVVRAEL